MHVQAEAVDRQVAETVIKALKGSNKPFLYTSGGGVLGETDGAVDESVLCDPNGAFYNRAKTEQLVVAVRSHACLQSRSTVVWRFAVTMYQTCNVAQAGWVALMTCA